MQECEHPWTHYLNICAVCNPLGQLLRRKANPLEVKRVGSLRLSLCREMHEGRSTVHVQLEGKKKKVNVSLVAYYSKKKGTSWNCLHQQKTVRWLHQQISYPLKHHREKGRRYPSIIVIFPWALFIILTVIFIACFKFMLQSALHNKEIIKTRQ